MSKSAEGKARRARRRAIDLGDTQCCPMQWSYKEPRDEWLVDISRRPTLPDRIPGDAVVDRRAGARLRPPAGADGADLRGGPAGAVVVDTSAGAPASRRIVRSDHVLRLVDPAAGGLVVGASARR